MLVQVNHGLGTQRWTAFTLARERLDPCALVVCLRPKVLVKMTRMKDDDLSRLELTMLFLEPSNVGWRNLGGSRPIRAPRAAHQAASIDYARRTSYSI